MDAEAALKQRQESIKKATEIRMARAEIKQLLKAKRVSIEDLILNPPEEIKTATVYEMLLAQKRWGKNKARNIINKNSLHMSESTQIKSLTDRQRDLLINAIRFVGKTGSRHDTCPGCGGPKFYTSKLCIRCHNKK